MVNPIKDFILWKFNRETSQYLIFCVLIVAFIFLTPNNWFEKKEQLATRTSRLIVQAKDFLHDERQMAARVKELSGNQNAEIIDVREVKTENGESVFEIDIR